MSPFLPPTREVDKLSYVYVNLPLTYISYILNYWTALPLYTDCGLVSVDQKKVVAHCLIPPCSMFLPAQP